MKAFRPTSRDERIGIALEKDRLVALRPREAGTSASIESRRWIRPLTLAPDGQSWTDLAEALTELRALSGERRGMLHVALMPPLSHFRQIELAGVTEREATQLVSRDPSRFLPVRSKTLVVALEGAGWRLASPFLLTAAPAPLLEAIGEAVRQSGWSLGGVLPAQLAWAASIAERGPRVLIVRLDTHIEILHVERQAVVEVRRVPIGREGAESTLPVLLAERGIEVDATAAVVPTTLDAATMAAQFTPGAIGPTLLPEVERIAVRQRTRQWTVVRLALAAALLIAAAALELWGSGRERANVAAERARIRRSVAEALVTRESVAVLTERLTALRAVEADAPQWSAWVAKLADHIPSDAFLLSLTAEGDSLRLEGAAERAAPVFDAVASVQGVSSVRPEGAIRQEVRGGDATSEQFVLAAQLTHPRGGTEKAATPNDRASSTRGRTP